jgi:hypothetical protein
MKKEEQKKIDRFGNTFVTSLKPVRDKLLNAENKVREEKIFDFSWKEGLPVKQQAKSKKKGSYDQMNMVFYNPSHTKKRIENIF